MKICLLIKDFAVGKKFLPDGRPTKSGAEIHGENHAVELIKLGHQVTIMTKKRFLHTKAREKLENGIDLVRLPPPIRWLEIFFRLLYHRNAEIFRVGNNFREIFIEKARYVGFDGQSGDF